MLKGEIIGRLSIMKEMNIKPNFSELARKYGVDRHTIAKYWKEGKRPVVQRDKKSYLDPYLDEIKEKIDVCTCTRTALFKYFQNKYGADIFKNYSTFIHFLNVNEIYVSPTKQKAKVRYETGPGDQLQVDWKENMKITLKNGEVLIYQLFVATFSYSRYHYFIYSKTKTTEDFLRCLIDVFYLAGGIPKRLLTDNMTAVVSLYNGSKKKHAIIKQFEKDIGMPIQLCKVKHPFTKGKVESANRFAQWFKPYDGELESEEDVIEMIQKVSKEINNEVNRTTGVPPVIAMAKEIEHLQPIPNKVLLNSYVKDIYTQTVPETLLVNYKGCGYSVSKKLIGKKVKIVPIDNKLYIYFNTELQCIHDITKSRFNYKETHYIEGLKDSMNDKSDEDIKKRAEENLRLMDKIGE